MPAAFLGCGSRFSGSRNRTRISPLPVKTIKTAKHLALNHIAKWDNQHCDSLDTSDDYQQLLKSMQLEDEVTSKERFLLFCRATEQ